MKIKTKKNKKKIHQIFANWKDNSKGETTCVRIYMEMKTLIRYT